MPIHFNVLIQVASNINKIKDFIEGKELIDALSILGGNAVESARFAMQMSQKAYNKEAEVGRIISHLQDAHVAYRAIWKKYSPFYLDEFYAWTKTATLDFAVDKDIYVLCLMTLCYVYLNEFQLARECISLARDAVYALLFLSGEKVPGRGLVTEPSKMFSALKAGYLTKDLYYNNLDIFAKEIENVIRLHEKPC